MSERQRQILLCGFVAAAAAGPSAASANATAFSFTGGEQRYTVPAGVSVVHVEAIGGPGGQAYPPPPDWFRGMGADVSADLAVAPGETLYVEVGGAGGDGSIVYGSTAGPGGYNGGAAGGAAWNGGGGGGGGGASDVRTDSRSAGGSLASRLLVAAGGGGGGGTGGKGGDAGSPGGDPFDDPHEGGGGGAGTMQTGGSGGAGGVDTDFPPNGQPGVVGVLGAGGSGGASTDAGAGGGGGGGVYGGGGGGGGWGQVTREYQSYWGGGGGGGGASFAAGTGVAIAVANTETPLVTIEPVTVASRPALVLLRGAPAVTSRGIRAELTCLRRATPCVTTSVLSRTAVGPHRRRAIAIGSATVAIRAGTTRTVHIGLNAAGRRMVASSRRVPITLTVLLTVRGHRTVVATRRLLAGRSRS